MTGSAMSGLGGMVPGPAAPTEMAGVAPPRRASAKGGARTGGENSAMSDGLFAALLTAALTTTGRATTAAAPASKGESSEASVASPSTAGSGGTVPMNGETAGSSASAGETAEAAPTAGAPATSGTPTTAAVDTGQVPLGATPGTPGPAEAQARANTAPEAAVVSGEPPGPPPDRTGQSPAGGQSAETTKEVVVASERVTNAGQSQDASRLDRVFVEAKIGERQMEATAPDEGGDAKHAAPAAEAAGTNVEKVTAAEGGATGATAAEAGVPAAVVGVAPDEAPAADAVVKGTSGSQTMVARGPEATPGDSGARTGGEQGEPTGERQPAAGSERRGAVSVKRTPVQTHHSEAKDNAPRLTDAKAVAGEKTEAGSKPSEQAPVTSGVPADAEGSSVKAEPVKAAAEAAPQPALAAQAAVNRPAEVAPEARRGDAHAPARAELRELPELVRKAELVARTDGPSEMRLQLVPEHLGRLSVRVSVDEGVVTARLVVENPQVKALVEERLPELTRALQDQGLRLTNVSVGCENSGNNQNFQGWQGERQMRREMAYGSGRRGYDDLPAGALRMVPAAASHQWRGSGGVVDALV